MGHNTNAIIGKMPIDIEKVKFYGLAVAFEEDCAIVFLDESHLLEWWRKLKLNYFSKNDNLHYGDDLVIFFAKEIGFEEFIITYISYQHFAEFYKDTLKIDEGDLNIMLRKLGVEVYNSENEFHQLKLDKYRMAECFYWDGDSNWAKFHNNVIAGRIDE